MGLYEYGKSRGMTNDEARIFAKITKRHPGVAGHGQYAEKTGDYSDGYLQQWVDRVNGGMYGAMWSGDVGVHRIIASVIGKKRYWKLANKLREENGEWKNEDEFQENFHI